MRLLVDMDGVITDFEQGILNAYRFQHPGKPYIPLEQRTTFRVKDQYTPELQPFIEEIYLSRGFFQELPPIKGSIEAVLTLVRRGDDVRICTTSLPGNPYCVQEKYGWIASNIGSDWTKRLIITEDRTIIHADKLIDDNPHITGIQIPTWEHILYTQPYNLQVTDKKRLTWQDWTTILK